ncbi:MAG: flagellar hook-associated protein FlgL [Wenzhouxiangellaceae bacterium]|nr:flagellar hook-associated protein FlgL [Wenzhouxiangellaceae bacterium]
MRISTQMLFRQGIDGILQQQARAAATQRQIATGQRVNKPSDDPVAAARIQELERSLAQQDVFLTNIGRIEQRLKTEEAVLTSAGELVQRVRELAVQASNDAIGDRQRELIAIEMRDRLEELVSIGNTRDGDGEFLFGGAQKETRPFELGPAGVSYRGDSVQRELLIGAGTTMADGDTGDQVFMRIRDGNGTVRVAQEAGNTGAGFIIAEPAVNLSQYSGESFRVEFGANADGDTTFRILDGNGDPVDLSTVQGVTADPTEDLTPPVLGDPPLPATVALFEPGQTIRLAGIGFRIEGAPEANDAFVVEPSRFESMFDTIGQLAAALETKPFDATDRAGIRQQINDALGQLDNAETRILEVRAGVGGRLNTLDDINATREEVKLGLTELVSDIRDLDFAEAVSLLQQQLFTLEAAQQSFAALQGNSLFRFI